jgi:hypothetical protein
VTAKPTKPSTKKIAAPARSGLLPAYVSHLRIWWQSVSGWFRKHWLGLVLIGAATLIFFWPMVVRISSYSYGGDAMFNAWTLARDHHCLLRDHCANFSNGNIFYPHQGSMLYSESQLSAGVLTLPLHFINANPLFAYNVWTISSFFLGGFFMYLLANI